jgi:hypothetical protein
MRAGKDFVSSFCRVIEAMVQAFVVPALRKLREERGTRFVGDASKIKGRATRLSTRSNLTVDKPIPP